MAVYKTPGVYIEEITTLPPSVAPVATAIPAFVGYTQKAVKNGEVLAANTPTRIQSLLDFIEIFGGPFSEYINVAIADPPNAGDNPSITCTFRATGGSPAPYILYHQVAMFYSNGGGPCHIISVGSFIDVDLDNNPDTLPAAGDLPTSAAIDAVELTAGVAACAEVDEVTLLVVPEAVWLTSGQRGALYDAMLAQCNLLQDRFAIMDVISDPLQSTFDDGITFRGTVGNNDLKYGAAYYPQLKTLLQHPYAENDVEIADNRSNDLYDTERLSSIASGLSFPAATPIQGSATLNIRIIDFNLLTGDSITINGTTVNEGAGPGQFAAETNNTTTATNLAAALNTALNPTFTAGNPPPNTTTVVVTVAAPGTSGNSFTGSYNNSGTGAGISLNGQTIQAGLQSITSNFSGGSDGPDLALHALIKKEIAKKRIDLYPCGTIAGVYARIDRSRGVWKAPANTSAQMVKEPLKLVTDSEQETMNVDENSGKSINVIRNFFGKGNLVWGARTLAGNDNEWRYVNVRRFFNFAEESIEKATEPFVFEPNDANTWIRVKGMIENFLVKLWRDGALAGAVPADAFFVKVGLGETMTALDILEGRMNVEIGMAVVRPAEFIILKFSHKMQES